MLKKFSIKLFSFLNKSCPKKKKKKKEKIKSNQPQKCQNYRDFFRIGKKLVDLTSLFDFVHLYPFFAKETFLR